MAGKYGSLLHQTRQLIGKLYGRTHSESSSKALQSSLRTITSFLRDQYGLQKIENIKPHMVTSFFAARQEAGLSASQLGKDASAFRAIAEKCGKQNIIPRSNKELGFSRSKEERMQPKTLNRTASAAIREKLVERYEKSGLPKDQALIAAYDLRSAFGLRAGESIKACANGNNLDVVGKGGRFRSLPAISTVQKAVLAELRTVSKSIGNTNGKLIPPDLSLKQMYDYQRNTVRAYEGTKAAGTNMHAARHYFAQQEKSAGTSDKDLAEKLGHGREDVVQHYSK